MTPDKLKKYKAFFADHIARFNTDDPFIAANLKLKEVHTQKVCDETDYLTDALDLPETDRLIASAIALFHDISRFEQFYNHRTFADAKTFPHSIRSADILTETGILADLPADQQQIIDTAVRCHGQKSLPADLDERTLLFCRLIRDADKIDIYRVVLKNYREYHDCPEGFVMDIPEPHSHHASPHVIRAVLDKQPTDYASLRTVTDVKLLQLGWIFDLNFSASLARLHSRGQITELLSLLPDDPELKPVHNLITNHLKTHLPT
ncbi:hypothetical protein STSP2_00336 [Anaerohalosphaera lusitana]|uniref:HD domain-containing protein n=1 Tax=Anaerohalosphaera lusitana TaxID=1936003 RepID=A0A1U9NGY6_9BACT|nr:HD domain-containing protein [Anaerohalosphaera lusitana]AQT67193.1 hypothetical protein STSP2_00336 [Anaerohalosphaera lusitana]